MDSTFLKLEGALTLIRGQHLDKRIAGLNDIRDIVVCIEEKEWKKKQRASALSYVSSLVGSAEFPYRTNSRLQVKITTE